jgi:flavoprotein
MACTQISPFVCGNISTNSVAKISLYINDSLVKGVQYEYLSYGKSSTFLIVSTIIVIPT